MVKYKVGDRVYDIDFKAIGTVVCVDTFSDGTPLIEVQYIHQKYPTQYDEKSIEQDLLPKQIWNSPLFKALQED